MATSNSGWLRGRVKAVPSGDCVVIMAIVQADLPLEKTITLASIMAPKLARRGGVDEPFAWDSREFLRKLCLGKDVVFKVDYTVPSIGREFGTVFLGDKNLATLIVAEGWAKVREPFQQKDKDKEKPEGSPFLAELRAAEEKAKQLGLGRWSQVPGASEASIRDLPPSAIGDPTIFDAMGFLASNKGKPIEAIVEQVRDGHSLRVYLLPGFQFVQVFVAGVQAPSMGRRAMPEFVVAETEPSTDGSNGDAPGSGATLTSAQRFAQSVTAASEVPPDPFAREAKHFTEIRVLNRDVRIVLEGVDKNNNLIGSVYYPDGDAAKDLALDLIKNGFAKYVEWSGNMMEDEAKRKLKAAELQAKKDRLRMWTNYQPPASNSKPIHDQNFTGKVVEVVSGDCIIVADDSVPSGSPASERRVNLSSIKAPKMGNPRRDVDPEPTNQEERSKLNEVLRTRAFGREAREFLRTRLIGRQVNVSMEYSRKMTADLPGAVASSSADSRVMDFGSVILASSSKNDGEAPSANQQGGINVAEMLVSRGLATVVRHRDFEERSKYYDALVTAESRAINGRKGMHSSKDPPAVHVADLSMGSVKKARDFLPFLQKTKRHTAVVEYVFSGHRFKLYIPKETCSIAFALSGVRAPAKNAAKNISEPYADESLAFMRRKVLQRDVEIEVETVDRTGTFLGSLYESKTNVALSLVEEGLAKLQTSFGFDRIPDSHLLVRAEQNAKQQKKKIWENYVEGEEISNGSSSTHERKQKETMKVVATDVLSGGMFYVQKVGDADVVQQKLAALSIKDAPVIGSFNPTKGSIVLAHFSLDNSWNRAMIVSGPKDGVKSASDEFEVFYIDYGNQEKVPYSCLRPADADISSRPDLALLCKLAHIKVPELEDDCGPEAAEFLSYCLLDSSKEFEAVIEERDITAGKTKGRGTGSLHIVTLVDPTSKTIINATMLQEGFARLERKKRFDTRDKKAALEKLEEFQEKARKGRENIWQYGDIQSDDDESGPPAKAGGRR
ncbi:Nuclease domain-containing protein 1 [Rhynchospora pubera]|uniref:Ribonuclease n=1 Tax=Rhynchospora pubera TaxID=906938 RepID=A0AAV8CNV8_9POAL|nr:Nuclease domain-containing protein 1 [Rhynchospora pubera]